MPDLSTFTTASTVAALLGIAIVLIVNHLAGQSADSLYIRRGNLRLGLIVGLVAFASGLERYFIRKTTWTETVASSPRKKGPSASRRTSPRSCPAIRW